MQKVRDGFMFRSLETERTRNTLAEGRSVLIVGLRRIGKTWLMGEVGARLENSGREVIWLDVQDLPEPGHFYLELLGALPKGWRERLISAIAHTRTMPTRLLNGIREHIGKFSVAGQGAEFRQGLADYAGPLSSAIEEIIAQGGPLPILVIDELPFFLENLLERGYPAEEIRRLLATLRSWREKGLPMLIGGSISLEHLLESIQVPRTVLGGLKPIRVHPFTLDEARQFLLAQASEHARTMLDEASCDLILEHIPDHIPFLLRVVLDNFHAVHVQKELEAFLANDVLPEIHRSFFTQFDERLSLRFDESEQQMVKRLLDYLCKTGEASLTDFENLPLPHPGKLGAVLAKMQLDDFVMETPQMRYRFSLELLRRWWCGRRGIKA
ncbi:MAG: hypothetical protein KGZ83_14745 [Sulfuricella sp.]|nr:hypothetical protein [Sulfuricella sp.]